MVYEAAQSFANDVQATVGSQRADQVEEIWLRVRGKQPSKDEQLIALDAFADLQEQWEGLDEKQRPAEVSGDPVLAAFCHAILNSAAALFVD